MMNSCSRYCRSRETGAVLVVGLLILLVMTILGVASLQTTSLEERMAGNIRDRDLSLQAAESALRDAEAWLETIVTTGSFDGTGGLYGIDDDADDTTWGTNDSRVFPQTHTNPLEGVAAQPRYVIQYVGIIPGVKGTINIEGYRKFDPGGDVTGFEITAIGYGADVNTTTRVRTVYGRRL